MQLRFRSFNRHVLAVFAVVALAACGSNTAVPQVDPKLTITSAGESATRDYYLTGTAVLPAGNSASLQYRLDGGDWQTVPIGRDSTFSAVITLDEGSNLIQVALTAGETRVERELTVNVNVSGTPVVIFTSDTLTNSRAYRLSGLALDDFGVEQLEYRLNSEPPVELPLSGNEFEAALTLAAGMNTIAVTATDGAGNAGTATLTVTFEPQIKNARADPMVAQHSTTVTLTGSNFGTQPGTVHFGNHEAAVQSWSDSAITVTTPRARQGGWLDITISGAVSEFVIRDFFSGIEIVEQDLLAALQVADPEPGTALLLSGSDYFLDQGTSPDSADALPTFSLYGARTDNEPTTVLHASEGVLSFATHRAFSVRHQDLTMRGHQIVFRDSPDILTLSPASDGESGLRLDNVVFEAQENPSMSVYLLEVGLGLSGVSVNPQEREVPVIVSLNNVTVLGFESFMAGGANVRISGLDVRPVQTEALMDSLVIVAQSRLEMSDSSWHSSGLGLGLLLAQTGIDLERNKLAMDQGTMVVGGGLFSGAQWWPALTFIDNELSMTDGSNWLQLGGSGSSEFKGNRFNAQEAHFQFVDGDAVINGNIMTASVLQFTTGGAVEISGNHVSATGSVQLAGDGNLDVTDNVFEFTGGDHSVAAIAMNAPAAAGATQVEFHDNLVSGRNRLFAFHGGAGDLGVNMTGNTFNAELRTVGDVATLTNVVAPSLITTSDNRWGDLESAAAVLELIELTASDADRMTVAEF